MARAPAMDADLAAILAFAETEREALGVIVDQCCDLYGQGMGRGDLEEAWRRGVMRFLTEGPAKPRIPEFMARFLRLIATDQIDRLHEDLLRIGAQSSAHAAAKLAASVPVGSA